MPPFMPVWKLIAPIKGVRAFKLSRDGRYVLAEVEENNQRFISFINLHTWENEKQPPQRIAQGWGAAFNNESDKYLFVNAEGLYVGEIEENSGKDGRPSEPRLVASGGSPLGMNAGPVWSPDSQYIFAMTVDGIWQIRASIGEESAWSLALPMKKTRAFGLSAGGRYLLIESEHDGGFEKSTSKGNAFTGRFESSLSEASIKKRRYITLTDLASGFKTVHVGLGWASVFGPHGDFFYFHNFEGPFVGRVIDGKTKPF